MQRILICAHAAKFYIIGTIALASNLLRILNLARDQQMAIWKVSRSASVPSSAKQGSSIGRKQSRQSDT